MARNILSRQEWRLREKWVPEDKAKRIAYWSQRNNDRLDKWFQLNDYGKQYSEADSLEREILRRAKRDWRQPRDYTIYKWKVIRKK